MTWNFKVRHRSPAGSPLLIPATTVALLLAGPAYRAATAGQTAPPRTYSTSADVETIQDFTGEIPAHLSVVDGPVTLEREGRAEAAEANIILLAGDRLRTARSRAEVLFADGSSLALDDYTTIDLLDASLMRLVVGRTRLQIARATGDLEYRVDSISGSALIRTPGDYRLSLADARGATNPEFELAVLRGSADLVNDLGRTAVRAGARAVSVATAAPSPALVFNVALNDSFDRWTMDQRQARMGYQSAQYLPTEISYYSGAFDTSGSWEYYQPYGYVWYPTVPVG
ncbi:MAG TPA: hypothetical protein VFO19_21525 [Vicinamibacterales bacterium]|nr:hypothetical protein [Vicinamibacterales bacterium]